MREEGCDRMGEGCRDSRPPHPSKLEARSGSRDWHMDWRDKDMEEMSDLLTVSFFFDRKYKEMEQWEI